MKLGAILATTAAVLLAAASATAQSGFDLRTEFILVPCTINQNCTIQLKFTNDGPEASTPNGVSLNKYNGKVATGYATRVGGSGAILSLPALDRGESVTLTFVDPKIKAGTYTYQPRYSSALNDRNNNNHRVTRTITY